MVAAHGRDAMNPETWSKWFALYKSLASDGIDVAAPFMPYVPAEFTRQKVRVLYLGKATKGNCEREDFDRAAARGESAARAQAEAFSRCIFEQNVDARGPNFWGFANEISKALNPKVTKLKNIAWSNVCKIGAAVNNPEGILLNQQVRLAIQTLNEEIENLSPTIILCVANSFADPILLPSLGCPANCTWEKSEEDDPSRDVQNVWWLAPAGKRPAVVWMRHPQGSANNLRAFSLEKTIELANS